MITILGLLVFRLYSKLSNGSGFSTQYWNYSTLYEYQHLIEYRSPLFWVSLLCNSITTLFLGKNVLLSKKSVPPRGYIQPTTRVPKICYLSIGQVPSSFFCSIVSSLKIQTRQTNLYIIVRKRYLTPYNYTLRSSFLAAMALSNCV